MNRTLVRSGQTPLTYPVSLHRLQHLVVGLRVLNKDVLNPFRPEYSFDLGHTGHLEFAPVKVVFGQSDPHSDPRDVELLAVVNGLPEDVVVLGNLLLVDLPGEVGGRVGWLAAAVELEKVPDLVLLDIEVCGDGGSLVREF